jgi:hypothetical protein
MSADAGIITIWFQHRGGVGFDDAVAHELMQPASIHSS